MQSTPTPADSRTTRTIDAELLAAVQADGADVNAALALWQELDNPREMLAETDFALEE